MSKKMCKLGDTTTHGGSITINPNGNPNIKVEGVEALADGAQFICPIHPTPSGGGTYSFTGTGKAKITGSNCLRDGDMAGCGAQAISSASKTYSD